MEASIAAIATKKLFFSVAGTTEDGGRELGKKDVEHICFI